MKNKSEKKIALIGYVSERFQSFETLLDEEKFSVYRIHSVHSWTKKLLLRGVSSEYILDLSDLSEFDFSFNDALDILSTYEQDGEPLFKNIILMDRLLRECPYEFAVKYLAYCATEVEKYLLKNKIEIISSGRDTALQMTVMLVAKKLNLTWACVTYTKLPKGRFGFSTSHIGDKFLDINIVTDKHRELAKKFLEGFRSSVARKVDFYQSPTGFVDVLKKLPRHTIFFFDNVYRHLTVDRGNDFAVSPIYRLLKIFIQKKMNLLYFKFFLKYYMIPSRPYVFFGLHRQPESSVDVRGAFFSDQLALIKQIARSIPSSHELCVKVHISDVDGNCPRFYKKLQKIPGVRILSPFLDTMKLIKESDLVITNSGAPGYEAGLLGNQAIAFSKAFWTELPTVHYIDSPEQLPSLVQKLLMNGVEHSQSMDDLIIDCLATVIANSVDALPNRSWMNQELNKHDISGLREIYNKLYEFHFYKKDKLL